MDGQEDAEGQDDTHERDLNLVLVVQDRTARVLSDGGGDLTGAVEARAVEREAHAGMELLEEEVEGVLETVGHPTILCAGVSGLVVHCPSYCSPTRTTQA